MPGTPSIQVRLLGGLELRLEGRPVEIPGRKVQALLARLARRPGDEAPRAHLADLLWPDRGEEQARGSLRQALAALRRLLGDALRARPDAVSLDPAAVQVDVAALEGSPAEPLEAAGRFLDGFPPVAEPFDDWVHAERAALAARALEAFRGRLAALAEAGDPAGLALAERALALDPTFEPAYRARMQLLAAAGDRAAALREHARCREALSRAVGVEPGAATEALRRRILEARAAPAVGPAAAAPPGGGLPAVAVMPFELLTEGATAAPFARGLAEDVQFELSRLRSLRVLARDAAARAAALPPDEAGRALGADYLLHAAVREGGGRIRVNARLTQAASGRQVWAERLDADLADVLVVQERIARAVAAALQVKIDEDALAAARRRPAASLDAYALWLAGMEALRRGCREGDLEGRALFLRALEIDPGFARAHTGLSLSYFNDWSCAAWERWEENATEARRHAAEAARLDPRDHVTHCILGRILLYRREFAEAEGHLRRSLALVASDADVLAHLAIGFAYLGAAEDGLAAGEAARQLNPFHPDWYLPCLAMNHLVARRPGEALPLLGRAPDGFVDTRAFLAAAAAEVGDEAAAREHARRFVARFRERISPAGGPAEALRWLLLVNPFRREEDRAWLVGALARAGVTAPAGPGTARPSAARP